MLKYRIISGTVAVVATIFATKFLHPIAALFLIIILSSVAQLEFYRFMRFAGLPAQKFIGLVCGAALIAVTLFTVGSDDAGSLTAYRWEQVVMYAIVLSVFIYQLFQSGCDKPIISIGCTLLGIIYVPYLFNFFTRLAFGFERVIGGHLVSDTGRMLVLYAVVVIKITDIGAFFVGRKLGRHKMFPRVSPGKTWEGFAGGIVVALLASIIFQKSAGGHLGVIDLPLLHAVILGALLSSIGVLGDLFESMLKRNAGAKDSGTKVPGMGGILDVFDSLLFGVPTFYIYIKLFLEAVQ